jgi:polysaccharide biosynthesis transport protein
MEPLPNVEEIDFQKHFQVLQRNWLPALGVFGMCVTIAFAYTFTIKPSYKAEGTLLIKTNSTSSLTGLGEAIGKIEALTQQNNPSDTQAKILVSNGIIQETIRQLNLKNNEGKLLPVKSFLTNLKVDSPKGTDILQVSYQDKNPELAAKAVNQLMNVYVGSNIRDNRSEAVTAGEFVNKELPSASATVQTLESQLRKFKEENKIIALQEEARTSVEVISRLEEQITQAQARLLDTTARVKALKKQASIESEQAVASTSLNQVPGIQQIILQLQESQSRLAVEKSRFNPGHPTVVNLQERTNALRNLLQERIRQVGGRKVQGGNLQVGELRQKLMENYAQAEAERAGLVKQVASLSAQKQFYRERANTLPRLEQKQRELERKLKAAQATYENLLSRQQEIQAAENQKIGNARIVSYAIVPDTPTGPSKMLVMVAGVFVGVFAGAIAAFCLDLVDRSVKTVREAKELFQYTLLGVIPTVAVKNGKKNSDQQGIHNQIPKVFGREIPLYPTGDSYQMLQANLKFLSSDKKLKAIVVSSSVSQEGKSEVAANLALAMAQVGKRVLLVDADMRHPVQHHVWGLTNAVGLSNIIVDKVDSHIAIQEVMPNLFALPSGVLPPNPVALLDSKRMAALVSSFAEKYDVVIFDTPALSGTADAAVLSKLADGILLVVRPGILDWNSANAAKEFLTQSGQNVLGMVINGVNIRREADSYFYYTRGVEATSSKEVAKETLVSGIKEI